MITMLLSRQQSLEKLILVEEEPRLYCGTYGMEVIGYGAERYMHAPWEVTSKADVYECAVLHI